MPPATEDAEDRWRASGARGEGGRSHLPCCIKTQLFKATARTQPTAKWVCTYGRSNARTTWRFSVSVLCPSADGKKERQKIRTEEERGRMKITVFSDTALCCLAETDRRFMGAYVPIRDSLVVEAVSTFETSASFCQTTRLNSHLRFRVSRRREWRWGPSGIELRVVSLEQTDVSEVRFIRMMIRTSKTSVCGAVSQKALIFKGLAVIEPFKKLSYISFHF
jgi:hypothetical protein